MSGNKPEVDIKHVQDVLDGVVYQVLDYASASVDSASVETLTISQVRYQLKDQLCGMIDAHGWPIHEINIDRYIWGLLGDGNGNPVTAEKIVKYKEKMQLAITKTEFTGWYTRQKSEEKRQVMAETNLDDMIPPNQQF